MTTRTQRDFLKVQLLETQRLREISRDHPLMSVAFAHRERELESEIAALPPGAKEPRTSTPMKTIHVTLNGDPIGKPRMTQADKWRRRPCVLAYRAWADKARYAVRAAPASIGFHVDGQFVAGVYEVSWIAFIAMPASWSKKKKDALRGQLQFGKPDRDNIDKAILDALFPDDRGVATGTLKKLWDDGLGPRIEIAVTKLEGVMP